MTERANSDPANGFLLDQFTKTKIFTPLSIFRWHSLQLHVKLRCLTSEKSPTRVNEDVKHRYQWLSVCRSGTLYFVLASDVRVVGRFHSSTHKHRCRLLLFECGRAPSCLAQPPQIAYKQLWWRDASLGILELLFFPGCFFWRSSVNKPSPATGSEVQRWYLRMCERQPKRTKKNVGCDLALRGSWTGTFGRNASKNVGENKFMAYINCIVDALGFSWFALDRPNALRCLDHGFLVKFCYRCLIMGRKWLYNCMYI